MLNICRYFCIVVSSASSSVRLIYIEKCSLLYTIIFPPPKRGPKPDRNSKFRYPNRRESVRYRTDSSENRTLVTRFGRVSANITNYLFKCKNVRGLTIHKNYYSNKQNNKKSNSQSLRYLLR